MKPGDLVYLDDITTGFMLGIVLRVVNPYPEDPNYERCEVFWNGKPPHWMKGSVCSSHILKVVK